MNWFFQAFVAFGTGVTCLLGGAALMGESDAVETFFKDYQPIGFIITAVYFGGWLIAHREKIGIKRKFQAKVKEIPGYEARKRKKAEERRKEREKRKQSRRDRNKRKK